MAYQGVIKETKNLFLLILGSITLASSLSGCAMMSGDSYNKSAEVPTEKALKSMIPPSSPSIEILKSLAPPAGLNTTPLFNESIKDSNLRMLRLERNVQQIRDDLDMATPAIVRLVAIEQDIRELISQLEEVATSSKAINHQESESPELEKPKVTPTPPMKTTTDKKSPPSIVNAIRVGEHQDKSRIVIDLKKKIKYEVSIDKNTKKALIILKNTTWSASQSMPKNNFILSYKAVPHNGDTQLSLQLKDTAKVKFNFIIPPDEYGGHRLVIDLHNAAIHH